MTTRQRKYIAALATSKTQKEAAIKAGYSESSASVSATKNIKKYNNFYEEILAKSGIDSDAISKVLRDGLNSKNENVRFKYAQLFLHYLNKNNDHVEFQSLFGDLLD